MKTVQVEPNLPVFVESELERNELEDETSFLNFWQIDITEFMTTTFNKPEFASSSYRWPSKDNPNSFYKFSSFWVEQGQTKTKIERSTYGLLDWVGDVGGLADGLIYLIKVFVSPFAALQMKAKLHFRLARLSNSVSKNAGLSAIGTRPKASLLEKLCGTSVYRSWTDKRYRNHLNKA